MCPLPTNLSVVLLCAAISTTADPALIYDYKQQGADWTNPKWDCLVPASQTQSPVDIQTNTTLAATSPLQLISIGGYQKFAVGQNLHRIRVTPSGNSDRLVIEERDFYLQYYDIHAGAEHTLDGKRPGIEVQMNFRNPFNLHEAVLSFLYESVPFANRGPFMYFLEALNSMPELNSTTRYLAPVSDNRLDMFSVTIRWLVDNRYGSLLTYEGTKTAPPCSTAVHWFIFDRPLPLPVQLLKEVAARVAYSNTDGNYREVPTEHQSKISVKKYDGTVPFGVYMSSGAFGHNFKVLAFMLLAVSTISIMF